MGLIKFGGGVSAISGKIGGTVYARNRGGAYARNWAKPTNTPTTKQSANRLAFGNVSKDWAALTQTQQDAWNALASTTTRMNRLGDAYTPTGRQIFLESANNMRVSGNPPLTDAPFSLLQPTIDGTPALSIVETTGAITTFRVNGLAAQSGITAIVEATKVFAQQKGNFTNDYRQVDIQATAAFLNILTGYTAVFGAAGVAGNQVSVRMRYIDTTNGMASPSIILTDLIA